MPEQFLITGKVNQVIKDGVDSGIDSDVVAFTGWSADVKSNYPVNEAVPDNDDINYNDVRTIVVLPNGDLSENGTTAGIKLPAHDPAVFETPLQYTITPLPVILASGKRIRPKPWTFNALLAGQSTTIGALTPVTAAPLIPVPGATNWAAITGKPVVIAAGSTAAEARAAIGIDLEDLDEWEWSDTSAGFPVTGTANVVYGARDTGLLYRWNGAAYAQVGGVEAALATATGRAIAFSIALG